MSRARIADFLGRRGPSFVVVLGSDEIASAIAVRLTRAGRRVVMVRDPADTVTARGMAFDDAAHGEAVTLDGIVGLRAESSFEIAGIVTEPRQSALVDLDLNEVLAIRPPDALVDARRGRREERVDLRGLATVVVGIGAGFIAGVHCDAAVDARDGTAGRVTWDGSSGDADFEDESASARGRMAAMAAPCAGRWRTPFDIGRRIYRGMTVGRVDGEAVVAPFDGRVIGIVRDDALVRSGIRLVDIDPPGGRAPWRGIDPRGREIGEGVLRALETAVTLSRLSTTIRDGESLH